MNSVRRALEARHEVVHSRWFLFDFADPQHPAIAGVRYLPVHKRAEPDEPSAAYERTVKQFRNYLNDLNDQIENWRYWIEELNIIGDYGWAQKGFIERSDSGRDENFTWVDVYRSLAESDVAVTWAAVDALLTVIPRAASGA